MGISKYNSEGYHDPTPHKALNKIIKEEEERKYSYKPLVYICSPYSGDVERNVIKARKFCRFALEENCIPLAPHLLFPQFMNDDDPEERELAIFMDIILLGKCSEVWVLGNEISSGMAKEIDRAKRRRQKIRYFSPDYKEVESL